MWEVLFMVCQNCGNQMSEGANFCRYCGAPVTAPQEPASAAQTTLTVTEAPAVAEQTTLAVTQAPVTVKNKHIRRALVSLLLFVIFTGGLAVSGWFAFNVWQKYNTPYQAASFAALDEKLEETERCAEKLAELDTLLKTNAQETRELEANLANYRVRREDEILSTVTDSVDLDYNTLFATEPFTSAYLQYMDDLLSAFRQDSLVDSWLYPYYTYSVEYGANIYIDLDLWIYNNEDEREKFNELLTDPQHFYISAYTTTLTDHITLNDHLYVTGLDMLNTLFRIPGYVLDGAVFVKAYGGSPSPEEMDVPEWTPQDYSDFWTYAESYNLSERAVWEDFGLSAMDFNVDWNTLVDEDAYYKAYEKFMNTIAPGLDRYDMAQYTPDDEYYGGVRYTLPGSEATLKEIAAAYISGNPACLTELDINTDTMPSSYDDLIALGETQLKELAETAGELELQKTEVKRLQDSEAFFRQQQESLFAMEKQHMERLKRILWIFGLSCTFLFIMAATSLRRFIRALR